MLKKIYGAASAPVFIFAASWRSGSTLLQRIVNASGEVFVWGEPAFLPEALALHRRLGNCLSNNEFNRRNAFANMVGKWIPVVSPSPAMAAESLRSFFNRLYGTEASSMGRSRWGFKEVRADAVAHMQFLSDIYPDARCIFLVRDPWNSYRSVKGKKFHANFKDPLQPVRVWESNVSGYLGAPELQKHCLLVRYEDLIKQTRDDNTLLKQIADHIGVRLDNRMHLELETLVDPSGARVQIEAQEMENVIAIVAATAARLGYERP